MPLRFFGHFLCVFSARWTSKKHVQNCPLRLDTSIVSGAGSISRANLGGNGSASPSVGSRPPAHPPMHRLGPLRGRLAPLPPVFPGWTPGMPCVVCLRGHPTDAVPLRTSSLRSVVWGPSKPRLRRATPRFAWAPYGRPGGGLAALPHLATSSHPPSLHSAALRSGRSDARRVTVLPSVGLASARLSPPCHPSLPPYGRSVRLPRGSTRSPPGTPLRSVPVGPRLRLKAKPAKRGVARLFEASTAGATPPAHGRALGRPKTDDGGGRFAPCALPSVGHRLSVFPWRLPPSLGVPSGAPHEAAARRSLRSLCLAPPSSWLSLPSVARP